MPKSSIISSPFILVLLSFNATINSNNDTDFEALLAFKKAIHDDPLGALSSWNETTHFCKWNGVSCSKRHPNRVVSVFMRSQGLVGSLPSHIGNLSFLRSINLQNNTFRGQIPEEIGRLRRLRVIQFSNNSFGGGIPRNLSQCRNLYYLNLIDNQLTGSIVPEISSLVNLSALGLSKNMLSGTIPPFLSNLTSLTMLSLNGCGLQGDIPESMAQLRRLRFLSLMENNLSDSLGNLSSQLWLLHIGANQLSGSIPSSIGNLFGLTFLILGKNDLQGRIPSSIGKLHKLQVIYLTENKLTNEIPSSFGNLTLLNKLALRRNHLSGNISPSLGNCSNLLHLDLAENNLNGSIPPEIMSLSSISIFLDLSNNLLMGNIPSQVGALRNLGILDLSHNRLSGILPTSFSSCVMLESLHLESNSLHGEISDSLSALKGLQDLDLSMNNFSGMIPSFVGKLDLLMNLNLSFNSLNGEVPTQGVFQNETAISLQGNRHLCGGIAILKLPSCPSTTSRKKKDLGRILFPIGGAVMCLVLLACFSVIMYWRRTSHNAETPTTTFWVPEFLRLSYGDLSNATCGFSETNLVGAGRFGSVYRGSINVNGDDEQRDVAVKVLNLNERGASRSLESECNALRGIRHRNLLKILSVCESIDFRGGDFKALVYEFMANGSLENWLHQISGEEGRILSTIQRLDIGIDIASVVEYLHCGTDFTVIHGDLKPSNILLDQDMVAHVGDFGLAKIISSISGNLSTTDGSSSAAIKGTIGYIAPEYGMNSVVSTEGDAYSYGILLLEMFTNIRPTSDTFVDLQDFITTASSPDRLMEAVDPFLHQELRRNDKYQACVVSILRIGVRCSKQFPRDRMSMAEVVIELKKIRNAFLAADSRARN